MGRTARNDGEPSGDSRFASLKELFPSLTLSPAQKFAIDRAITLKKQALIFEEQGLRLKALRLTMESDALINRQVDLILNQMKSSAEG